MRQLKLLPVLPNPLHDGWQGRANRKGLRLVCSPRRACKTLTGHDAGYVDNPLLFIPFSVCETSRMQQELTRGLYQFAADCEDGGRQFTPPESL